MCNLVQKHFIVPEKIANTKFIARKLCASDVYLDYLAVMSSIDTIRKTRGGSWPTKDLTFEDDLIDLGWHQREFENKSTFAYTVMNPEETECLGCFYLYKPGTRKEPPKDADVDLSWWVTDKAYEQGLYEELFYILESWLKEKWPFQHIFYSNNLIPNR